MQPQWTKCKVVRGPEQDRQNVSRVPLRKRGSSRWKDGEETETLCTRVWRVFRIHERDRCGTVHSPSWEQTWWSGLENLFLPFSALQAFLHSTPRQPGTLFPRGCWACSVGLLASTIESRLRHCIKIRKEGVKSCQPGSVTRHPGDLEQASFPAPAACFVKWG